MDGQCPECGMFNAAAAERCSCGRRLTALEAGANSGPLTGRAWAFFLVGIGVLIVCLVLSLLLISRHVLKQDSGGAPPPAWEPRLVGGTEVLLEAPGPLVPLSKDSLEIPPELAGKLDRVEGYGLSGEGFEVRVVQLVVRRETRSAIPPGIMVLPYVDLQAKAEAAPGRNSSEAVIPDEFPSPRMCVAGDRSGLMVEDRIRVEGQLLHVRGILLHREDEMLMVTTKWLDGHPQAEATSARILTSFRLEGNPLIFLEASSESLTSGWTTSVLIPGSLVMSAPSAWTEVGRESVAYDAQIPGRPRDAKYFYCQCGATSLTVGTGICSEDLAGAVERELRKESPKASYPRQTFSVPEVGILAGRRAVVWNSEIQESQHIRRTRKTFTAEGRRAWVLSASYESNDPAAEELVKRVESSLREE